MAARRRQAPSASLFSRSATSINGVYGRMLYVVDVTDFLRSRQDVQDQADEVQRLTQARSSSQETPRRRRRSQVNVIGTHRPTRCSHH